MRPLLIGLFMLASVGCAHSWKELALKGAHDLNCTDPKVMPLSTTSVAVEGCGKRAVYRYGAGGWTLESKTGSTTGTGTQQPKSTGGGI